MSRIEKLETSVAKLYENKNESRAAWADWLFTNHVVVVADFATELAEKYSANAELARAAALLHDIADVKMQRNEENHEAVSLRMARELLEQHAFSDDEIKLVVDDAIRFHSCHDGQRPESLEGKVLATADSMAHLKTDFYVYATWQFGMSGESLEDVKEWTLKKIERDLNDKISFDDEREAARTDYDRIKTLFSR